MRARISMLAILMACSGRDSETPQTSSCAAMPWGGWDGTPECAGIAATMVSPNDRGCQQDGDCIIVGANPCEARSVNAITGSRFSNHPPPCKHPLAGMCLPTTWRAVCQQGCCAVTR